MDLVYLYGRKAPDRFLSQRLSCCSDRLGRCRGFRFDLGSLGELQEFLPLDDALLDDLGVLAFLVLDDLEDRIRNGAGCSVAAASRRFVLEPFDLLVDVLFLLLADRDQLTKFERVGGLAGTDSSCWLVQDGVGFREVEALVLVGSGSEDERWAGLGSTKLLDRGVDDREVVCGLTEFRTLRIHSGVQFVQVHSFLGRQRSDDLTLGDVIVVLGALCLGGRCSWGSVHVRGSL